MISIIILANLHSPFCGIQNFEIACKDGNPIIRISEDDYVFREISYKNHAFRLTNALVYNVNSPTPLHNFSLHQTPFNYSSNPSGLFLFSTTVLPFLPIIDTQLVVLAQANFLLLLLWMMDLWRPGTPLTILVNTRVTCLCTSVMMRKGTIQCC